MTTKVSLGSVSHGTMRTEDLLPKFTSLLEEMTQDEYEATKDLDTYKRRFMKILECRHCILRFDDEPEMVEWSDELVNELFDYLSEFALPYCYFGAHDGDGSDYGFWISHDSLEEACSSGEVVKVDAGDEHPKPEDDDCEYFLEVSDHGNMTLFTRAGEEVWSVV